MTKKLSYIILILGLGNLGVLSALDGMEDQLVAKDSVPDAVQDAVPDSVATPETDDIPDVALDTLDTHAEGIDEDIDSTTWHINSDFGDQLVIDSYEDLLEYYYNAVVAVDQRLNPNPYRLQPSSTDKVNPFIYDDVVLPKSRVPNLAEYLSHPEPVEEFGNNAEDVFCESREYIAQHDPQLITATWDQMPDPPKTDAKMGNIKNINLDLSQIDKQSRKIGSPDKLDKQSYIYAPWETKIVSSLNANQTAYANWAKGGSNSFALSGRIVADADYVTFDKKVQWDNTIEMRLGYMQQEEAPFVKNLDLFRVNSQFARNAINKWYYAVNAELTSQFFKGYDYKKDNYEDPISAFLSPAYLKIAVGLDYKYSTKKNKKLFSMQASPLSYKLTYVRDTANVNQAKYGVETDKRQRQEIGGSVKFTVEYSYGDKISSTSRLQFFSNYMDKPENVDINWDTSITYQISRVFAINFTLDVVYDDDIEILLSEAEDGTKTYGQRVQLKEFFGFGLTYRLM